MVLFLKKHEFLLLDYSPFSLLRVSFAWALRDGRHSAACLAAQPNKEQMPAISPNKSKYQSPGKTKDKVQIPKSK